MYRKVNLVEGVVVQFVGVYVTRWLEAWGKPTVGFVPVDYQLEDAVTDLYGVQLIDNTRGDADRARQEIEAIFRKLLGDR